ncbi:MAG: oligosaccharide flippase family protein [Candidatus Thermoplasmatota archaeon]|nr:oligosaccharide flippase family protein [Candidatus Thermoplasmatota archaeon]
MDRALKTGKDVVKGSFWLFTGRTISTVLLAVGTIILGFYIDELDYGLYTIALILPVTLLLFQDWGVSSAMTKYCSQYKSEKREGDLRKLIKVALIFGIVTASVLTIFSLLVSNFVATLLFSNENAFPYITIASISILPSSFLALIQSILIGFERMRLNSVLIICQAAIQSVLSILLVYLNFGALGATVGYSFSFVGASILALFILYFKILKGLPSESESSISITKGQILKLLLSFGVPLGVATILGGILPQFTSFIMASSVDEVLIGNYKIAHNFATMLTFVTFPIFTVLFPAYSKFDPDRELHLLKSIFSSSVKYVTFLLVPVTLALMVLAEPLISTLYADKWSYAPLFLSVGVIGNLLIVFGNVNVNSLLTGLGKTKVLMKLKILTIIIGIPSSFVLIPQFNIIGLIITGLLANTPSMAISLYYIWKHYRIKAEFRTSAKIFLASSISALCTWIFLRTVTEAAWVMLSCGTVIFLVTYVIFSPLVEAVTQDDIRNLRVMFSSLGIVSRLVNIPLLLMNKILKLKNKNP